MVYATVASGKHGDPDEQLVYRDMPTPLGEMRLVASAKGLRGAWFTDQALLPSSEGWLRDESNPILEQGRRELEEWFAKDRRAFDVALDPVGTPFQPPRPAMS